ncbi:MAG: hypothetical protein AAGA96_07635 [Verrucomicrobiota bacterium]
MRSLKHLLLSLAVTGGAVADDAVDLTLTDRYGGLKALKTEATGWFRVEKFGERWLFVTPEGHGYFALGANHVGKYLDEQAGAMGLLTRFNGSREQAAEFLINEMRAMGLNSGEAYAPIAPEIQAAMPWVANIAFPGKSKFAFDPFDPAFQESLYESTRDHCLAVAENPLVLGIAFADLPVWDQRRIQFFENLPETAPGAVEIRSFREAGKSDDEFLGHVADEFYQHLRAASKAGAPNHLFFGERFRLRGAPDEVIASVARHVDVFCTQALILSPQRPPEWQIFQEEGFRHEAKLIGDKPMMVIDWAAPFSLRNPFETIRGRIEEEITASEQAAEWLVQAATEPYMIGIFKCQLIGLHGNDKWFDGRSRRTYLQDDGTHWQSRTGLTRQAHLEALRTVYQAAQNP